MALPDRLNVKAYVVGENAGIQSGALATMPTIQSAVAAAQSNGGGLVVIPAEYAGSDTFTAVAGVQVLDFRNPITASSGSLGFQDFTLARVTVLAQTGVIGATNFVATTPAKGVYRVSLYAVTMTTLGASPTFSIGYTDDKQAQTQSSSALGTAAGSFVQSTLALESAGTAQITYSATTDTSGTYNAYLVLERLS